MILCGEMLLLRLGWSEAAERLRGGLLGAIDSQLLTADLAALVPDATSLSCAAFADAVIEHMDEGPPTLPRSQKDR